jgi:hypothetical protein
METSEVLSFQIKPAAAQMAELLNVVLPSDKDSSSRLGAYIVYNNLFIAFHMACISYIPQLAFPVAGPLRSDP